MALADFYSTNYTQRELAEMLASYTLNGEQPPIPDLTNWADTTPQRGRPSATQEAERLVALAETLENHYPVQLDLAFLSGQTGIARPTLVRLTQNSIFLRALPLHLRPYFQATPLISATRLTPLWRGLLDLHYYSLMLGNGPGVERPKFYTWHTLIWGQTPLDPTTLPPRNHAEFSRVLTPRFEGLVGMAGLPLIHPEWGDKPFLAGCTTEHGCPLTRAFVNGNTAIAFVDGAIETLQEAVLMGSEHTLFSRLSTVEQHIPIAAPTAYGVVAQILGVET